MKTKRLLLIASMAGVCSATTTQAAEINWHGFMSVVAGKTLDNDTLYTVDPITTAAYDDEIRFDSESIVGLQGQAIISDNLRATVQLVSKGGNKFDTEVDWAYLSYDLTDSLTLNAGRFRLPLFYYSDFLDVGYAYHWIRPPVEVYNVPHSSLEGVSLYHTTTVGDLEFQSQAWYGSNQSEQDTDFGKSSFDVRNDMGANTLITWEWLKVRLLYNTLDLTMESELFDAAEMETSFMAAALMLDYNNVFWRSEYTVTKSETAMAGLPATESTDDTWYASVGYHIGNVTPHYTHTEVDGDPNGFTGQVKTDTIGVSWAFHPSAKLKVEYLQNERESAFFPKMETDVISTAIDIVF